MKFILSWFVKKFGIAGLITTISVLYFAVVTAFYLFVITVIGQVYHIIQNFFDLISSATSGAGGGSGSFTFGSLLNVVGFTPALQDSIPLITSALVFLLTKILYKLTKQTYKDIVAQSTRAANLYV